MKAFWDPAGLAHAPAHFLQRGRLRPHHEVPARAEALLAACARLALPVERPKEAGAEALQAVHDAGYLGFLAGAREAWAALEDAGPDMLPNMHPTPEMLAEGGHAGPGVLARLGHYVADTACAITPGTWPAARGAAAAALAAAAEAAAGRTAYALSRPPGHHAYAARAGGHCYLNNAALAAEALCRAGAGRVAVLDIDSHHGNGTQGIFWERGDVLFVSVHGDPDGYYPWYVGRAGETGAGPGAGANLNLPLARGSGDAAWLAALAHGLGRVRDFGAEALVLSLGFDASASEPLGYLAVTPEGFARAGQATGALRLPTAIVQEGGYDLGAAGGPGIGALLERFLDGWGLAAPA